MPSFTFVFVRDLMKDDGFTGTRQQAHCVRKQLDIKGYEFKPLEICALHSYLKLPVPREVVDVWMESSLDWIKIAQSSVKEKIAGLIFLRPS